MRACAKVILLGEHFVVHGAPAIAIPVKSLFTEVKIDVSNKDTISNPYGEAGVLKILELLKNDFDTKDNFSIQVTTNIPSSAGLGSSASLSVAMIRALSELQGSKLGKEDISQLAIKCEKIFHGSPSGIDNTVIAYARPIIFDKSEFEFCDVDIPLTIIDSGEKGDTKKAVSNVAKFKETNPELFENIIKKYRDIFNSAKLIIKENNFSYLGALMNRNHELLQQIGVSDEKLDKIVSLAMGNGAHGAKLAGSGLGGCVVALGHVDLEGYKCYEI